MIQSAAPPPGVFRTSSAHPAQTNDIASVTTMSGTLVTTTSAPLIDAQDQPQHEDADDDRDAERVGLVLHQDRRGHAGERHHRADRQVDAAGDDDDRLGDGGERDRQGPDREALELRRRRSSAG